MSRTDQEKFELTVEVVEEARRTFVVMAAIAEVVIEAVNRSAELWAELSKESE